MAVRHDYSAIGPLGSHAAKRCPVRVQLDVLRPVEPLPPDPAARLRMDEGIEFEASIVERGVHVVAAMWSEGLR